MKVLVSMVMVGAGLAASATLAVAEDGGEALAAQCVVDQLPVVNVAAFPTLGPAPVPMPEHPMPRLKVTGLAGKVLVDVVPFDAHGEPIAEAFDEIATAFRARSGDTAPIDPRLVEVLMMLSKAFDDKPIALVSAHRIAGRGTRKTSYHTKGMAADIAIRGVKVHALRKAAARLGAAGVGVYPSFIHVDVRKDAPYRWVGGSHRRWRRRR